MKNTSNLAKKNFVSKNDKNFVNNNIEKKKKSLIGLIDQGYFNVIMSRAVFFSLVILQKTCKVAYQTTSLISSKNTIEKILQYLVQFE